MAKKNIKDLGFERDINEIIQQIIQNIEAGEVVDITDYIRLNEENEQHLYEVINKTLGEYFKKNRVVTVSATQLAHLKETGYLTNEQELKEIKEQLKDATEDFKKKLLERQSDLERLIANSKKKGPVGNEIHKILELMDEGRISLSDDIKAIDDIEELITSDTQTFDKLKGLLGFSTKGGFRRYSDEKKRKNIARALNQAKELRQERVKAGFIEGQTETPRAIARKRHHVV